MEQIKNDSPKFCFFVLFTLSCIMIIGFRWLVLKDFSFKHIDSDQAIMWNAAVDFSNGIFHEPRFFGQNYNSMLEGILSVPLLWCSLPVYKALPITTSFLALFPFFLVSIICIVKNLRVQALIVVSIPLFLPLEYDFLTSLPRGFVTGIFVSSFGWIAIFFPNKKWAIFCFGFFTVVGYSLNPNALILTIPLFAYLFIENIKIWLFYLKLFIGLGAGWIIHFFINYFYVANPNYNSRQLPPLDFSFHTLISSFEDLDKHFNSVSPIFWNSGWLVFVAFIIIGLAFLKQKKAALVFAVFICIAFTLLSLGFAKIHDGTDSIFFSYARMFLVIPVGFAFFIPFIKIKKTWIGYVFPLVSIFFLFLKLALLPSSISSNVDHKRNHILSVDPIEYVLSDCHKINYYSKKHKTDLVIVYDHGYYDFIDFGCSACLDSFPKTLRPEYERRTWRLVEDKNIVYSNIIIIDEHQKIASRLSRLTEKSILFLNVNGYYIVSGNTLKTEDFLSLLNIPIRDF